MNENPKYDIDLKEIVTTHIYSIEVIVDLLIEQGFLTRQEYADRINDMKVKRQSGSS